MLALLRRSHLSLPRNYCLTITKHSILGEREWRFSIGKQNISGTPFSQCSSHGANLLPSSPLAIGLTWPIFWPREGERGDGRWRTLLSLGDCLHYLFSQSSIPSPVLNLTQQGVTQKGLTPVEEEMSMKRAHQPKD